MTIENQIAELKKVIAAQEGLRATLGDAAVDATIAVLQEKLAELETQRFRTQQQRKLATVLMADVSGFTAISETMDAEEVTDVMNALWSVLDSAIVHHGGLIDKHMGDAVMALWGADETHEDDPENAIRAALNMQAALAQFRQEHHVELKMRIGINTGAVLFGQIGTTGEFTAMGDTVNLTSRLEHAAPVDGILISHDAYRHVRGVFDVVAQQPLTVKGKTEPVQSYLVLRAKPRTFRVPTRGIEGIETHMIGRDAEFLALQNAYHEAVDNAKTTLVTVVGDAGIGKSRLLYEFDNWIELRPEEIWYFKGRTSPQMQTVAYSLIRDVFRNRFDILESDSVATVLEKFRDGMAHVLDAGRADLVGHMVGFDFSTSPAVANLLGNPSFGKLATAYLTSYFETLAGDPTVMFLEDLHWADDSSLSLLNHLLREIPAGKLLLVCLARPTLFERHPDWGETHLRLTVQPLSMGDSQKLVEEVLQRMVVIPDDLRQLIVDGAEGNPFYVEELIKMLLDDGIIQRSDEGWYVETEQLSQLRVPSTLTGVMQARLDRLPPIERATLQHASVVGRFFWDAVVAELASDDHEVTAHIDALYRRELVFPRERSAFTDTVEYTFKHAVLRDVAYETVLLKLRQVYHAQVARWLETHAGERLGEFLSLIAGHYELAGDRAKAADYLQRAAEALERVSDFRGAIAVFQHTLKLIPEADTARRAVLLLGLGRSYRRLGEYPAAPQHLEKGLALAKEAGDQVSVVEAYNHLSLVADNQGDYHTAEHFAEQALALAREIGDQAGVATSLDALGSVAYRRGEYDRLQQRYKESLAIWRELGDRAGIASSLNSLGSIARIRGSYDIAQRYYEESMAIYQEIGDRAGVAAVLNNLGHVANHQEKQDEAERYYEESLIIRREIGDRNGIAACLNNLGNIAQQRGDYEAVQRYYEESLKIWREIGARSGAAVVLDNLGHIATFQGDTKLAWGYFYEALQESTAMGFTPLTLDVLSGVARLRTRAGQHTQAAELLGLVLHHQSTDQGTKEENVEPLLATLREVLTAAELEATLERGKLLDLDEVAAEILTMEPPEDTQK